MQLVQLSDDRRRFVELTGRRFWSLVVAGYAGNRAGEDYWHCQCDCGKTIAVEAKKLKRGRVKSCGCLPQKRGRAAKSAALWSTESVVTPRWVAKRITEYGWCHHCAVTIPPGAGECSHVARNRLGRKEIRYDIRGTTMSVADAARTYGVNAVTIHRRLHTGWCIDCAFTIPRYSGTCQHRKRLG
jgi:hypothetical protein